MYVCTSTQITNKSSKKKLHEQQLHSICPPDMLRSRKLRGFPVRFPSAIETHAGALIQVHVGVTKETFGHTLHVSRHLTGQFRGRHFQVCADLRAGVNLRDVEAVALSWTQCSAEPMKQLHKWCMYWDIKSRLLTLSVCHAVKEDPVLAVRSVFDEGDVVAGLDAEHSEQLQFVSGQSVGYPATHVTFGNVQRSSMMGLALRMTMHLEKKPTCSMSCS